MVGILTRAKTSVDDKAITHLPIFVSQDAWIACLWRGAGVETWQGPLSSHQDYFLPLPSVDL